jgi:branched-chain amino acid transport system ATP-binding protein
MTQNSAEGEFSRSETAGAQTTILLLQTRHLSKDFGGVHAVAEVDFRLYRGELRCLIGPNGAGKSTFFKMLSGQLHPSKGTILFDGKDITGEPRHKIARLGMGIKNQVPSVWDGLSVYEHFWIAAHRRVGARTARTVAEGLLTELGLETVARREVGALAHGERQWVEIGMVVAQQPKLILLDEPTAGMAADEVERTVDLLRAVNVNASLVVVEHDMQFIKMIGGIVTVFHQGRILIEGAMASVLDSHVVREVYLGSGHARG